jgi:DnaD/phage-associated family protein
MLSITPVENIFIDEFMPQAPSDYVKVYLYGLRQCFSPSKQDNDVESFARVLNLTPETVANAFEYWARYRLVTLVSKVPLAYVFNHIQTVVNTAIPAANGKDYSIYNASVQSLFPGRMLTAQEMNITYDWLDLYHLPEEVILLLIQYCISRKGSDIGFKYIDKIARDWAEKRIFTIEAAEKLIDEDQQRFSGAYRVLNQLGITGRSATPDELALLGKWTKEFGFALDAILYACRETTCISNPNMRYLDKVLTNMHAAGVIEKKQVVEYIALRQTYGTRVKSLFHVLDMKDTAPRPEHFAAYEGWLKAGFKSEAITLAARNTAGSDLRWMQLTKDLAAYKAKGIFTVAAIRQAAAARPEHKTFKQTNAHYADQRQEDYQDIFLDVENLP